MTKNFRNTLLAVAAGAVCIAGGCAPQNMATQEQLNEVRMVADESMRTANTADYQAQQAKAMADEALTKMRQMMRNPMMMKMMKGDMMMHDDMMKKDMMKSMMK